MNDIITIQNIRGYCDAQGTAWLNVEDIARGLGFVQVEEKVSTTSGRKTYTTVRWARVNGYLAEFDYSPVKAGDFIPENVFYLLAMKASNEAAKAFQLKIANEILPAIRKHGMYVKEQTAITPDFLRKLADEMEAKDRQIAVLKQQKAELSTKASYCDVVLNCKDLVSVSKIAKDYGMSGMAFNKLLHRLGIQFKQGDIWLLYQQYAVLGWTSTKTQTYAGSDGSIHCRVHTYWTQKGRLDLYRLLKDHGYLPLIERDD